MQFKLHADKEKKGVEGGMFLTIYNTIPCMKEEKEKKKRESSGVCIEDERREREEKKEEALED